MKPFILVWLTKATGRRQANDPLALRVVKSIWALNYLLSEARAKLQSVECFQKDAKFL